jgi:transcriptional regulator of acetoin/glycerol metabolism
VGGGNADLERGSVSEGLPLSLGAYESSSLERALREAGGNATDAARLLGIGRSTFYRKLGKHGLRVPGLVEAP